jgi:hypothetical protein
MGLVVASFSKGGLVTFGQSFVFRRRAAFRLQRCPLQPPQPMLGLLKIGSYEGRLNCFRGPLHRFIEQPRIMGFRRQDATLRRPQGANVPDTGARRCSKVLNLKCDRRDKNRCHTLRGIDRNNVCQAPPDRPRLRDRQGPPGLRRVQRGVGVSAASTRSAAAPTVCAGSGR